ncbi:deoxyribodipyrimidine photo-lyase [Acrodontium crateriforme]|uniref:Deoxyribodipyrimidine photo-lyase n=1 Tax=Acrodontium crateriforme TaxID=150365 RepID=A0AAQ3M885_9PEZI|nr:deoxyribodipyrimidine photo-lyase [Acrodontium crateriforme]
MPPKKHARAASSDGYIDADAALSHPPTKRAKEIDQHPPFQTLTALLEKTRQEDSKPRTVLHWFRSKDLRQEDNKGLHAASQKAKEGGVSLITLYLHSPKDLEWHGTSAARSDFIFESLRIVKDQLAKKNIPLAIITAEERAQKTEKVFEFVKENDVSHVYANMEYEVDELRRDIEFGEECQNEGVVFDVLHDQTVVVPGALKTGGGGPHKVFTPYHKTWLAETKQNPHLYDLVPPPEANDKSATKHFSHLFEAEIPTLPETKQFASKKEQDRIRKLWPAGHDAGMKRLRRFLTEKVANYAARRSEPAGDPSSRMSAYFSAGIVSVREALQEVNKHNHGESFDEGDVGIAAWVREIVFREFYRQVSVTTPHTNMNLPQNLKFDFVEWEQDPSGWEKWCKGLTGVPFIDAGMRQLNTEAYMHNRLRMNTSSYLRANLLIDYRKGERYFAEHLIDWDLSNNTQGWEPSYTVFNPVVQAEKCDPTGQFIRKWVPELKDVQGKAVFAPHERLSREEFEALGYPRPHVDFAETARRAKERYKRDLAEADA